MSDNKICIYFSIKIFAVCMAFCGIIALWCCCFYAFGKDHVIRVAAQSFSTVIIDAGHGGRDGGAVGNSGIKEKDLNLQLSCNLEDVLKLCGIETMMTRKDDSLVCDENDPALKGNIKMTDLKNRLKFAESNDDSVFVSIHMNKFSVEKYKGLQVYYSTNNDASLELAKSIQNNVVQILQKDNTRKVKKANSNIFLLDRIEVPAVLIECGFLSNLEEEQLLCDSRYRAELSLLIADGIIANLNRVGNN